MDRTEPDEGAYERHEADGYQQDGPPVGRHPDLDVGEEERVCERVQQARQRRVAIVGTALGEQVTIATGVGTRAARPQQKSTAVAERVVKAVDSARVDARMVCHVALASQMAQDRFVHIGVTEIALQVALRHVELLADGAGADAIDAHLQSLIARLHLALLVVTDEKPRIVDWTIGGDTT